MQSRVMEKLSYPNYPGKNDYNIYAYVYSDEDKLGKKHNANTKITSTSDNTTSIDENNINLQSVVTIQTLQQVK